MTEKEAFLFDLWGYVVLEGVLAGGQLQRANEAVDRHSGLIRNREPGLSGGSEALAGDSGRGEFQRYPLTFERPLPHRTGRTALGSNGP
jgi:hypothetical protein